MLGKHFTLFTLLGFEVKMDLSWLFLALLIAWSLAQGLFPAMYEGLSTATYWWMGIAGVIGLLFSLVFHELSHSIVARQYGLPIHGITLFIFGGVAEMQEEPTSPKAEFLMAIAGPIASFVLAAGFYAVAGMAQVQGVPAPVVGVASYLGFLNGLLAVFNLFPGFPLDGGRVLRSALWHWKNDIRWATRIASGIGQGLGIALIALGVVSILYGNFVGGMWWFLIGMFLRGAASASYYQLMTRHALEGEPVRRFMTADPIIVSREPTVRQFVEDYVYKHYHDMFPVTDGEKLLGCVNVRQIKDVAKEDWDRTTVGEVMKACGSDNTIEASQDALKALATMQRSGNSRMMVTQDGRLVGVVALKDLMKLLSLKVDLGDLE